MFGYFNNYDGVLYCIEGHKLGHKRTAEKLM
jgi:hypothetical protein